MRMSQVFYSFTGFLYRYVQQIKNLFLYTALTGGFYYYDLNIYIVIELCSYT